MALADLPNRRYKLRGTDSDGREIELMFSISKKLYRCPGCRGSIPIGMEHVLMRIKEEGGAGYYQHLHRDCSQRVKRELRGPQPRPAT